MAQCYKATRTKGRQEELTEVIDDGKLYPFAPCSVASNIERGPEWYHGYKRGREKGAPLIALPASWYDLGELIWDDDHETVQGDGEK